MKRSACFRETLQRKVESSKKLCVENLLQRPTLKHKEYVFPFRIDVRSVKPDMCARVFCKEDGSVVSANVYMSGISRYDVEEYYETEPCGKYGNSTRIELGTLSISRKPDSQFDPMSTYVAHSLIANLNESSPSVSRIFIPFGIEQATSSICSILKPRTLYDEDDEEENCKEKAAEQLRLRIKTYLEQLQRIPMHVQNGRLIKSEDVSSRIHDRFVSMFQYTTLIAKCSNKWRKRTAEKLGDPLRMRKEIDTWGPVVKAYY